MAPDRLGRRPADIVAPRGGYLARDLLNIRSDTDRWKLAQQAAGRDGVAPEEWSDRLLAVSVKLDREMPVSSLGDLPDEWPPPAPLPKGTSVPSLDPASPPPPLRSWLEDVANRSCIPLEFVACPALVAISAVVGRTIGILPVRLDRHLVVANLWGGIVGRPGSMKSSAVEEALRPLNRLAATAREQYQVQASPASADREIINAEIDSIKQEMRQVARGKVVGGDARMALLKERYANKVSQLEKLLSSERRYLTQDATVEKLWELLRDNPRGILVARDELAGWLRTMDKPGREGDREFFSEGWNGTGDYTFDRIARGTVHIPANTLSIIGGIQPGRLAPYVQEAISEANGADGLLQRVQLLVWPDSLGERKQIDRWADSEAKNRAYKIFADLDALKASDLPTDEQGPTPALRFNEDAQYVYDNFRSALEQRLRSDELAGAPASESHIAKSRSLMPSLALLFHLINIVSGNYAGPVSVEAAERAIAWCDFLERHAHKVYASELTPGVSSARALAAKIEDGVITNGQAVRDIYRRHWANLKTPAEVAAALDVLE